MFGHADILLLLYRINQSWRRWWRRVGGKERVQTATRMCWVYLLPILDIICTLSQVNLVYFNMLWAVFDDIDTGEDRRIDFEEFLHGICHLDMDIGVGTATTEFDRIDANGGGQILFDEFCVWYSQQQQAPIKAVSAADIVTE